MMLSTLQHDEVSLEVSLPSTSVKMRIGPWIIVFGSYLLITLCNRTEISCKPNVTEKVDERIQGTLLKKSGFRSPLDFIDSGPSL